MFNMMNRNRAMYPTITAGKLDPVTRCSFNPLPALYAFEIIALQYCRAFLFPCRGIIECVSLFFSHGLNASGLPVLISGRKQKAAQGRAACFSNLFSVYIIPLYFSPVVASFRAWIHSGRNDPAGYIPKRRPLPAAAQGKEEL